MSNALPAGGTVEDVPHELDADHASTSPAGPLVLGIAMVAIGLVMLSQTFAIRGEGFTPDGPRFLPLVVVVLWLGLSATYLGQQVFRLVRRSGTLPAEKFTHVGAAALLVVFLVAYAYALDPVGYVLSTVVFFVAASRVMGSHHVRRDVIVAVALTLSVYLLFTHALGVRLPQGVLPL